MTQTTRDDYSIDGLARLIHHIHQTYRYYDPQGRRLHSRSVRIGSCGSKTARA
jgi:hypothetical protein